MSRLTPLSILLATFALVCASCSHDSTGGGPLSVPLSYQPEHAKDSIRSYPAQLPQTRIFVGQIQDNRDRKDAIGENDENGTPVMIRSGSEPAEFFRQTLSTQLQRAGLHVVSDPSQADRVITGELTRFWVVETNNYEAEISANLKVADSSGGSRWQGAESGRGQTFGRSLSAENYRQALSDAMVRLTYENLLTNPSFQDAIANAPTTTTHP